jgi:ABC-type uncharacterized transport system ATPase subunit/ABC-type uncharacterized transport system permease subunit
VSGDAPALELRGITKRFGPVVANDGIDFDLRPGEVHALLGENGAGKSTLMSILYGLYHPDEGEILVGGKPVEVDSPSKAIDIGIGMVHQHFMLVPVMTVTENIVLGGEPRRRGGMLDRREGARRVSELSERYGLAVDPNAVIEDITVGAQQRVEILKTLYRDARILVLDEPTAVLTAQETADLFQVLRTLRDDGVAIVFISHKLGEVLEIADRVTVLRRGKKVDTVPTTGATKESLARLMVGRDVLLRVDKSQRDAGEPMLEVKDLHVRDDRELEAVRGLSLMVRGGEIVALAGVDGNGQHELVEAIAGLRDAESGEIKVGGTEVCGHGVRATCDAGVAHIAEDRHLRGLVLDFSLAENLALREYRSRPLSTHGWLNLGEIRSRARSLLSEYDVRGGGLIVPLLTALLAFAIGGLVVLLTGHDPIKTYKAIFEGTGLQWLFPWVTGDDRATAALNLQQTLILTTPLILLGLAVAFAFRAGLFNIGGQGQYIVGGIAAVWVGSSFAGMPGWLHIVLAIAAACLAGAFWAGIAGFLKATVGANEVISTIMLNYVALWVGVYLFSLGGPLQNTRDPSVPISNDVVEKAHLPVFWGDPVLQGLHIGLFIALAAVFVFWVLLNRSTIGYEVRAVGLNPEAARYGGMSVAKNYVLVMAVCGLFAGLAGSMDVLGWQFRLATNDIQISTIGFLGIAVALLGRHTAVGTVAAAQLFGGLLSGT